MTTTGALASIAKPRDSLKGANASPRGKGYRFIIDGNVAPIRADTSTRRRETVETQSVPLDARRFKTLRRGTEHSGLKPEPLLMANKGDAQRAAAKSSFRWICFCWFLCDCCEGSALNFQVLRRGLAAVRHSLAFDHFGLIEGGQTSPLDRGNMYEDILAATTLRLDEPVAFGRVEPFHSSCSHLWSSSSCSGPRQRGRLSQDD